MNNYVIVANPRTGTNMLVSGLIQNQNILSAGEILFDATRKGLHGFRHVEILQREVFRAGEETAKGFTLMCWQANRHVWDYLKNMWSLKIIYLTRHNLLEVAISKAKMKKTSVWRVLKGDPKPPKHPPFRLDKEYLDEIISGHYQSKESATALFSQHDVWEVSYENLCHDFPGMLDGIQRFLGIRPLHIKEPLTVKQGGDVSEEIINFNELRDEYAGTEYEWFFDNNITPPYHPDDLIIPHSKTIIGTL